MSSSLANNLTQAEFFTATHRVTGRVQTGSKPLNDLLNDPSQSYLLLYSVYISRLNDPGTISSHSPLAYLSKENLSFVLVAAREIRAPDRGRFAVVEYEALVAVPGFELKGKFLGPQRIDVRSFSPATLDHYVALTDVSAQIITLPQVTFTGEAGLVNRARLETLCLNEGPSG